jgi:UDP-3-O-[3-hydroxymyristoyl] glucosamine N-acyltransferase
LDENIISAVVTFEEFADLVNIPAVIVEKDEKLIIKLIDIFYPEKKIKGIISELADIHSTVLISENVQIDAFVSIGTNCKIGKNTFIGSKVAIGDNVTIGENCKIYPNVVIYDDCIIGNNVILHSGAVIGADGFGYINTAERHFKIRQIGNVILEDNVEIGANTCIDRSTLSSTVIGKGTKIDNLVQIAHNVKVGENCIIVSQVGIAGSTKIGNRVVIAGQAGIPDHIEITDDVTLGPCSTPTGSIKEKGVYLGSPLMHYRDFMKNAAVMKNLYELKKKVDKLTEDNK